MMSKKVVKLTLKEFEKMMEIIKRYPIKSDLSMTPPATDWKLTDPGPELEKEND